MKRDFDSYIVYEQSLVFGEEEGDTVYGVLYNSNYYPRPNSTARKYLQYLLGALKWEAEGNQIVSKTLWADKDGKAYNPDGRHIKEFCKQAYQENPIKFYCKKGIPVEYTESDLDGSFVISEKLGKALLEDIHNNKK